MTKTGEVLIDLEVAGAKEIAEFFTHITNSFSFNPVKTAEELRGSRLMKELDLCWLRVLSSPSYLTDGRNEIAARKGRQLAEIRFVKRKMESVNSPKMEEVAKKIAWEHRTLQQTFTTLVFRHFMQECNESERQRLVKVMGGEDFYKLPLI